MSLIQEYTGDRYAWLSEFTSQQDFDKTPVQQYQSRYDRAAHLLTQRPIQHQQNRKACPAT